MQLSVSTWLSCITILSFNAIHHVLSQDVCFKPLGQDYAMCRSIELSKHVGNCSNQSGVVNSSACQSVFRYAQIELTPYNIWMADYFHHFLRLCCGYCTKLIETHHFQTPAQFAEALANKQLNADFIYPVLGTKSTYTLYGHYFVRFIDVSDAVLITHKPSSQEITSDLIVSSLKFWPLLLISGFLALIAGFFEWFLDTWWNPIEFPRKLPDGLFEGFWWSFVSMTTVGYGDKSPRGSFARIFAVLWIVMGVTIMSMFTATLTHTVTEASVVAEEPVGGSRVGILSNRLLDASFVVKKGGIIAAMGDSLDDLVNKLNNGIIDAILLDHMKSTEFVNRSDKNDFLYFDKSYSSEESAYGVLLKNIEVYNYVNQVIRDNRLLVETCINARYKKKESGSESIKDIFSPAKGLFWPSFIVTVVSLLMIVVFGIAYEKHRKKGMQNKEDKNCNNIELQKKASVLDQIDELLINLKSDSGKEELMKELNEKEPQNDCTEGEGRQS